MPAPPPICLALLIAFQADSLERRTTRAPLEVKVRPAGMVTTSDPQHAPALAWPSRDRNPRLLQATIVPGFPISISLGDPWGMILGRFFRPVGQLVLDKITGTTADSP